MPAAKEESLRALYAQAFVAGEELLRLLSGPSPAGALNRVNELLEERGRIVETTGAFVIRGDASPDALPLLQVIVQQQAAIDAAFRLALTELQSQQLAAGTQRGKVLGAQNLLTTGPRSRLLNEYR